VSGPDLGRAIEALAALVLASALFQCGARRLETALRLYAAQSALVGLAVALLALAPGRLVLLLLALPSLTLKPWLVPRLLRERTERSRIAGPGAARIAGLPALLAGGGLAALGYRAALELGPGASLAGSAGASAFASVLVGLLSLAGRQGSMPQLVALLALENGAALALAVMAGVAPAAAGLALAFEALVALPLVVLLAPRLGGAIAAAEAERGPRLEP
jgi:hydrogenase-4 component E